MRKAFKEEIEIALIKNKKQKKWLAEEMGIKPSGLSDKLKTNSFSVSEIYHISNILNINNK